MRNLAHIACVFDVIPARQRLPVTANLGRLRCMLEAEHSSDLLKLLLRGRKSQPYLNARTHF
jgi:hypothetical protein